MALPAVPKSPAENVLLPVFPLPDICLFPLSSLGIVVEKATTIRALQLAGRAGRRVLALAQKDATATALGPWDLHSLGTIAEVTEDLALADGMHRVELDGVRRARVVDMIGTDMLVAEAEPLEEGDTGDEWGSAVEALARYLHSHVELRSFLDQQRRSGEPISWVNLACQHLPITATARQRLLESDASARCQRISRGLDALLRKEQGS